MAAKTILGVFAGIFLLVLLVAGASALSFNSVPKLSLAGNHTLAVLHAGSDNVTITSVDFVPSPTITSGSASVTFAVNYAVPFNISAGNSVNVPVSIASSAGTFAFGDYSTTLRARGTVFNGTDNIPVNATAPVTYTKSFCKAGQAGSDLSINNVDISNTGDEDDEWKPLDEITIEVEVDNDGSDDIDDVFVEIGLYDSSGKDVINDVDFDNTDDEESIEIGNLRDGDEETVTFNFQIPADFETGDYKLVVKAYSDDLGEGVECTDFSSDLSNDFYQIIDVISEDDEGKFIAFDSVRFSSDQVVCGDTVTLTFDAVNIGDEDQDQVKVILSNKDFGLSQSQEIKSGLDKGDDAQMTFTFQVPRNIAEKTYTLELNAEYDYRSGNYREELEDTEKFPLRVFSCTSSGGVNTSSGRIALISSPSNSETQAGEELAVKSRITNLGSSAVTFVVDAIDYEDWADLKSVSSRTLNLAAGESKEVTFTFDVAESAKGDNSFVVEVRAGDKVETREVPVSVSGSSGVSIGGDNWIIWIVGIVNIILIILIIIVAIRVSRR